jgi:hypothetical protein
MSRSRQARRGILIASGVASSLLGCGKGDGGRETRKKPDPVAVIALANSYSFVNPSGPVNAITPLPPGDGVDEKDVPTMTIARAVPKVAPAPAGYVILALVNSDKPYKRLGVETGDNYVWRDETDADSKNWDTYMVPASPTSDPKKLKRESKKYSDGEHTEPRLVRSVTRAEFSFGACLEDPACGSGHCGYGDVY